MAALHHRRGECFQPSWCFSPGSPGIASPLPFRRMKKLAHRLGASALVGLAGLLVAVLMALGPLAEVDWDLTLFTAFGEEAVPTRTYAEERLGDVFLRPLQGHDGKFFFVQANDPWVLDSEENADVLDFPLYRGQRMFYPVLAGGAGAFPPEVIVWAMLIVNLIAMGVGTWAVAEIAQSMGGSPWWGLAFALNLGFMSEVNIGGAGVVAGAAAFWGVAMLMKERVGWGVFALTLSALARESMLLVAVGIFIYLWRSGERKRSLLVGGVPLAAVGAWAVYLRLMIDVGDGPTTPEALVLPFVGLARAFESWLANPFDLLIGVVVLLILALFLRRAYVTDHILGWAFVLFVPLTLVLSRFVWESYLNATRAAAPIITAFLLLTFVTETKKERGLRQRTGVRE